MYLSVFLHGSNHLLHFCPYNFVLGCGKLYRNSMYRFTAVTVKIAWNMRIQRTWFERKEKYWKEAFISKWNIYHLSMRLPINHLILRFFENLTFIINWMKILISSWYRQLKTFWNYRHTLRILNLKILTDSTF